MTNDLEWSYYSTKYVGTSNFDKSFHFVSSIKRMVLSMIITITRQRNNLLEYHFAIGSASFISSEGIVVAWWVVIQREVQERHRDHLSRASVNRPCAFGIIRVVSRVVRTREETRYNLGFIALHWWIQDFPEEGTNSRVECANYLFGKFLVENSLKMKEFGRVCALPPPPPPQPPIHQCTQVLSISCSFRKTLAKSYVGAPPPPPGSWRPLFGEILDQPLHCHTVQHTLADSLESMFFSFACRFRLKMAN